MRALFTTLLLPLLLSACLGAGGAGSQWQAPASPVAARSRVAEDLPRLLTFSLEQPAVSAVIDDARRTVIVTVPAYTSLNGLVANFRASTDKVLVNGQPQFSGQSALDYQLAQEFELRSAQGSSYYQVQVREASRLTLQRATETLKLGSEQALIQVQDLGGGALSVDVSGSSQWHGDFQLPAHTPHLSPGSYPDVAPYAQQDAAGGMSWHENGRSCQQTAASFSIQQAVFQQQQLVQLDLRFDLRCADDSQSLSGELHWLAS